MTLKLSITSKYDVDLRLMMKDHYSEPNGFVGRSIPYLITYDGWLYGFIVSGSATRFLPGRDEFLGHDTLKCLNNIINNTFFHVERIDGKYPIRNFLEAILAEWERKAPIDWRRKYRDQVIALETLVELPRTGECYRRRGWTEIGVTKGFTCKRIGGKGTDSWGGKRVWDYENLRPKVVLMKKLVFV